MADGGAGPAPLRDERALVRSLLGREPAGAYRVVVRGADRSPVVIENAPFLDDGTPMPTRYWLVGRRECEAVGRLEASGGVARAAAALPAGLVEEAHHRYAAERDAAVAPDHEGPRPSGGVGGTRTGVKCLHAHLAWYLAGGGDPVGRWVAGELAGELPGAVAAIDCGTNSTRLLICSPAGESLAREMTITRLGEGVDQRGRLGEAAIARTLETLTRYRRLMDAHGVVASRAVATSAARRRQCRGLLAGRCGDPRPAPRAARWGGGGAPFLRRGDRRPGPCHRPLPRRRPRRRIDRADRRHRRQPRSRRGDLARLRLRPDHRAFPPPRPARGRGGRGGAGLRALGPRGGASGTAGAARPRPPRRGRRNGLHARAAGAGPPRLRRCGPPPPAHQRRSGAGARRRAARRAGRAAPCPPGDRGGAGRRDRRRRADLRGGHGRAFGHDEARYSESDILDGLAAALLGAGR